MFKLTIFYKFSCCICIYCVLLIRILICYKLMNICLGQCNYLIKLYACVALGLWKFIMFSKQLKIIW